MAKTRRRMARPPRRAAKRVKADWVYRPDIWDDQGALVDSSGTYSVVVKNVVPGVETAVSAILYDSQNRLSENVNMIGGGLGDNLFLTRAARAEGRGPLCLATQGIIRVDPATWALGSTMELGLRIVVVEQDSGAPTIFFDPTYNMWLLITSAASQPATFRNSGNIVWEHRLMRRFSSGNEVTRWIVPVNVRMRRRLKPYQALALYMEGSSVSVRADVQLWLRTLVADDGHD